MFCLFDFLMSGTVELIRYWLGIHFILDKQSMNFLFILYFLSKLKYCVLLIIIVPSLRINKWDWSRKNWGKYLFDFRVCFQKILLDVVNFAVVRVLWCTDVLNTCFQWWILVSNNICLYSIWWLYFVIIIIIYFHYLLNDFFDESEIDNLSILIHN